VSRSTGLFGGNDWGYVQQKGFESLAERLKEIAAVLGGRHTELRTLVDISSDSVGKVLSAIRDVREAVADASNEG
jgi:hypothetical protein